MSRYIQIYFSYFSAAFIIALFVVPLMRQLAYRLGAVDRGSLRRAHEGIIPRLGGVGIYLSFTLPLLFSLSRGVWDDFHRDMVGILLASTLVFLIGVYDDIKGARIRHKLAMELLAAVMVYAWGIRIEAIANPFNGTIRFGWLSLPVTVLWIIVITNAINLIDGLDGLAAGTGVLIAGTLFFLSGGKEMHFKIVLVILIGSLLGFLRHNFPPATIFMGDSGSLFLGFFLGSFTIISSTKATAMATMLLPIIAFAHPLTDMAYTVLRRFYRGMPLSEADREHIHHKLLDRGMSKRGVVLTLYTINLTIMLMVLFFIRRQLELNLAVLILVAASAVVGLRLLGYIEFQSFTQENLRYFQTARKRRYFHYVIKRFVDRAGDGAAPGEFRARLQELMEEYGLTLAEIRLDALGRDNPFFLYQSESEASETMSLDFPILYGGEAIGRVHLSKPLDEGYFLCTEELALALSQSIGRHLRAVETASPG
jgi:UDP-GlcNAc:undecaprenyl-phosphate GlcNAc-1-phosphate transferase